MKRALACVLAAAFAVTALSTTSNAASNDNAKLVLHLMSKTTKLICPRAQVPCNSIVTAGNLYPTVYFMYVLVTDGDPVTGIAALQFGVDYQGGVSGSGGLTPIDVYSWNLCATLEFNIAPWPNPGGGNLITWDALNNCQRAEPGGAGTGVVAVAGYFYMGAYAPSRFALIPRPVDQKALVVDCAAVEYPVEGPGFTPPVSRTPSHLGYADFGGGSGYNPCGLNTPTVNTTWSAVKSLYNGK